ncbi:hypothetical protein OQA88_7591 [Cercophora sp. LCS_1]
MATVTESTLSPRSNGVSTTKTGRPATVTAVASGSDASPVPAGFHGIRRSATVGEGAKWRPSSTEFNPRLSFDGERRRSSTLSDYSLSEAKRGLNEDILNPGGGLDTHDHKWSILPLIFALLPAVGGIFHKNGSSFVTDLMLLGLSGVFLNWSVTQPWAWYYSAQDIRVREELMVEMALEDDTDDTDEATASPSKSDLADVPEDQPSSPSRKPKAAPPLRSDAARRALDELYYHELCALIMCFTAPLMAAFLLHWIRDLLSRPSEALISNYNLVIFVIAAEIVPLSHMIKLVQARTLHLQRIVHSNPYREEMVTPSHMQSLAHRIDDLESRMLALSETATLSALNGGAPDPAKQQAKYEVNVTRTVRNSIQPDLDALNRAVRRYEKKASVLASLTEARLTIIDGKINDAISLAAAAAKRNADSREWGFLARLGAVLVDWTVWVVLLPVKGVISLCVLPLRGMTTMLGGRSRMARREGDVVNGKRSSRGRGSSGERMPGRLGK